MRSVMTKQFGESSFAMAIGAISTLQTACGVVGSLAFAQAYAHTEHYLPPFIYFVNAGLNFVALILALTLPVRERLPLAPMRGLRHFDPQ
jgi:hypothetical protein